MGDAEVSTNLERQLKAFGQAVPAAKPILEVNSAHPIMRRLADEAEPARFDDWTQILFDQATLAEGGQIENPAAFVKRLNQLMLTLARGRPGAPPGGPGGTVMRVLGLPRWIGAGIVSASVAACGGGENRAEGLAPQASAASAQPPAAAGAAAADNSCPLTLDQVTAGTGVPMTLPPGGCTFFPANGRDVPHVFYVLESPMVCNSITPTDLGFTETVAGLPVQAAYVRDQVDGSHVLVCRNNNARAFDIKNNKPQNREVAITLAKQVLAAQ